MKSLSTCIEVCAQHDTVPQSNGSASETSLADRQVDLTNEIREQQNALTAVVAFQLKASCFRH